MRKIRVLVVDDSVVVRRLVSEVLTSDPAIELAGIAANGRIALASSAYDDLPLMMVTTETEMEKIITALEAGANEYVMKPFTKDILREKLIILGLQA